MARTIKDMIKQLAHDEWGCQDIHRILYKPESIRYKCACGQDRGLLPHRLYPERDNEFYFNVLMSLCACGRVNYWIEWPEEEEIYQCQLKALLDLCDRTLKELI